LKIGSELGGPSETGIQGTDGFRHDLSGPLGRVERRSFREAEERVAKRKGGEDASVQNDLRTGAHSRVGRTRS
jgi:hypothetical protein